MNRLLFGDNLRWLQDRSIFPDESVDLVYLDPPFNSNADYNLIFREASGKASPAQFHAFTDTWNWVDAEATYREFLKTCQLAEAVNTLEAFHATLKTSPMMAYLAMMAPRLVELWKVLKNTGSLYLHCDPTASHYLKMLLDSIFGPTNFRNEIIWQRTGAHSDANRWGRVSDTLLFYSKTDQYTWHTQYIPYDEEYVRERYHYKDEKSKRLFWPNTMTAAGPGPPRSFRGKRMSPPPGTHWRFGQDEIDRLEKEKRIYYSAQGKPYVKSFLDERKGKPVQNIWTDIRMTKSGFERLGYQTQKPEALLERIINASSNPGDVVLDPFCGCGTTVTAAHRLKRQWIGIDITYLAINLIKGRLASAFKGQPLAFKEQGQPVDLPGAQRLAQLDRFQFEQWALSLIGSVSFKRGDGKGADRGVDGLLHFHETKDTRRKILVQVKSGGVKRNDVATLLGDVNNQKAVGGILITLDAPTTPMKKEAVEAGRYASVLWKKNDYPKIQILTVEGLLNGTERANTPPLEDPFAKAPKTSSAEQLLLGAEAQEEDDDEAEEE